MSNKKTDLFRRIEELPSRLYVILAIAMLTIHILICSYTQASVAVTGLILILIYVVISLSVYWFANRRIKLFRIESDASDQQSNSVIYAFRNSLSIPYAVVTENGKIVTVNQAMRNAAGLWDTVFNADISAICHCSISDLLAMTADENTAQHHTADAEGDAELHPIVDHKKNLVSIGDNKYRVECHPLQSKGRQYYMILFNDVTELTAISERYHNDLTAIAYIVLDNLEEIAQYVKVSYQAEARQVETILKDWATQMGAMIREYDRNKYILLLSRQMLANCIKNKFEILDTVREIHIGEDNMPITISMGVATTGETMAQRERDALVALDMAL